MGRLFKRIVEFNKAKQRNVLRCLQAIMIIERP